MSTGAVVNWLGGEGGHSSPSKFEVKNAWIFISTPISFFMSSDNYSQVVCYESSKPAILIEEGPVQLRRVDWQIVINTSTFMVQHSVTLVGLQDSEEGGTKLLRNVGSYLVFGRF